MKAKGYASDDIATVITDFTQAGLISDQRFAENYCYWRRGKGFGPLRISQELQARGVSDETIAELIQITDNAWFTEARRVWQKQFKGKQPSDFKSRAKQMRFLQYRGFTQEQIKSVFLGVNEEFDVY